MTDTSDAAEIQRQALQVEYNNIRQMLGCYREIVGNLRAEVKSLTLELAQEKAKKNGADALPERNKP